MPTRPPRPTSKPSPDKRLERLQKQQSYDSSLNPFADDDDTADADTGSQSSSVKSRSGDQSASTESLTRKTHKEYLRYSCLIIQFMNPLPSKSQLAVSSLCSWCWMRSMKASLVCWSIWLIILRLMIGTSKQNDSIKIYCFLSVNPPIKEQIKNKTINVRYIFWVLFLLYLRIDYLKTFKKYISDVQ